MNTARRVTSILASSHRGVESRCLHSTPQFMAKTARSPRVRAAQRQPPMSARVQQQTHSIAEDYLPPAVMLNSARKAGAIDIDAETALEFLRQYHQGSRRPTAEWEQKLCNEHKVSPLTVTILAGILRRCPSNAQKLLAKNLMLSASTLGEKSATFELILSAINTGQIENFPAPLQGLGILAKKDNDPEAMMLLGKVLQSQGKSREALTWLQKATQPPSGSQEINGAGDALVNQGRIHLEMGEKEKAEEAFRQAALDLDEPAGYFYLSQLQEAGSPNQHVYLLKAASSGILEACHNLGALELARIENQEKTPTKLDDYGMALEWFQISATDGFGLSVLNMALIHKAVGQEEEGLFWLQKAEAIPEVKEQAIKLKEQWESQTVTLP